MPRKRITIKGRCPEMPKDKLLVIIITAFIVGGAVYLWQNSVKSEMEYELKSQINTLNSQIMSIAKAAPGLVSAVKTTAEKEVVPVASEPAVSVTASVEEVRFQSCGYANNFTNQSWYKSFSDALGKFEYQTKDISSACYSEDGNMFIALIPTDRCTAPLIFKFNTVEKRIGKATVAAKGLECPTSPDGFGKREGPVIKMVGTGGDAECSWDNYYDYDYSRNVVKLMKRHFICEGDAEGLWTEY